MANSEGVSPKVLAGTVGAALATIIWIVVSVIWPTAFTDIQLASLTGASATVLTFALGWLVSDPARGRLDPTKEI